MEANPVTLIINYWTRNSVQSQRPIASNSRTSRALSQLGNPVAEGTVRISIQEMKTQSGTSTTIENLLGTTLLNGIEADANLGKQFRLTVTWDLDESVAKEVDRSSIEVVSLRRIEHGPLLEIGQISDAHIFPPFLCILSSILR